MNGYSKIHEFETTHLKSLAGAGAGVILAEEAAFLNPASVVFFRTDSFYAQRDTIKTKENNSSLPSSKNLGFALADANPSLSGTLSYVNQDEEIYKRERWGLSIASPFSGQSAFGISIRKTTDETAGHPNIKKYYQTVLGVTHAVDEKITLGLVAYDPFKSQGRETKAIVGLQYAIMNFATTTFDLGGDYNSEEISKTLIMKGAVQVKILDDFFFRFGGFDDKIRNEEGSGFGLGWVQPRLAFEFAIKNTKRNKDESLGLSEKKYKESSFAGSIRF